jgi:hypothetical protein
MKYSSLKLMRVSNGIYEVNVNISFKILNNVKLCTPLNASNLNLNNKINDTYFI